MEHSLLQILSLLCLLSLLENTTAFLHPERYHYERSRIIMSSTKGIGFVGIGIMGEGMAARLLSQNVVSDQKCPLFIWNRTESKARAFAENLKADGISDEIVIAGSAKEVVEKCDITFSMLSTPKASKAVFEDPNGVLAGVSEGKAIIDCATLAEVDMKRMSSQVTEKGGMFLEAPVSGSKVPAAMGSLIFLCAGSKKLFDNEVVQSSLNAMGKATHYFGESVGMGTRAKLVVNSLMGTMVAAFSESLALSESVGLDPNTMIEVISQGAIQSPVYSLKGPKMIKGDHAPNFPLKHAHKDMALAKDMASETKVEFSVQSKAEEVFREARADSKLELADLDFSAVFEKVHDLSNSEFSKNRNTSTKDD